MREKKAGRRKDRKKRKRRACVLNAYDDVTLNLVLVKIKLFPLFICRHAVYFRSLNVKNTCSYSTHQDHTSLLRVPRKKTVSEGFTSSASQKAWKRTSQSPDTIHVYVYASRTLTFRGEKIKSSLPN